MSCAFLKNESYMLGGNNFKWKKKYEIQKKEEQSRNEAL